MDADMPVKTAQQLGLGVPTGIEDVEAGAEEGEVEYFNLQGVRVMNPTNGIYIRKYGSEVTKVCL